MRDVLVEWGFMVINLLQQYRKKIALRHNSPNAKAMMYS